MKKLSLFLTIMVVLFSVTACNVNDSVTVDEEIYVDVEKDETEAVEIDDKDGTSDDLSGSTDYNSMFTSDLAQFRLPESGDTVVTLKTNYGDIHLLMFPEVAPKAVENFITHGKNGYYDGVIFHRVIEGFMIQGGDPTGTGRGGESIWGSSFEDEFSIDYFPYRGSLAMANAGPQTNGSQFFIVQSSDFSEDWKNAMIDYGMDVQMGDAFQALGGTPGLFNKHTVFGQVLLGMDTVDQIAALAIDGSDKPLEDVIIEEVIVTNID